MPIRPQSAANRHMIHANSSATRKASIGRQQRYVGWSVRRHICTAKITQHTSTLGPLERALYAITTTGRTIMAPGRASFHNDIIGILYIVVVSQILKAIGLSRLPEEENVSYSFLLSFR